MGLSGRVWDVVKWQLWWAVVAILVVEVVTLNGPNVCMVKQKYNITKRIKYRAPMSVRTYEWCFSMPPRCSRWSTEMRDLTRLETEERQAEVAVCCPGYRMRDVSCVPICPHGKTGPACAEDCPQNKWGPNCVHECPNCSGHGACSRITGECQCQPGWQGERCDSSMPAAPVTEDTLTLPTTKTTHVTTRMNTEASSTPMTSTVFITNIYPRRPLRTDNIGKPTESAMKFPDIKTKVTEKSIDTKSIEPIYRDFVSKIPHSIAIPTTTEAITLKTPPVTDKYAVTGSVYNRTETSVKIHNAFETKIMPSSTIEVRTIPSSMVTSKATTLMTRTTEFSTKPTQHATKPKKQETTMIFNPTTIKFKPKEIWIRPAQKEPEHITAVMGEKGTERSSADLVSVLSIAGGVMMSVITVAVVIVMVERCRRPRYQEVRKVSDIRMQVMIDNDVPPPPYVRSIFHTPLPDPPIEKCHYQPISTLDRNLKQFMRPVVVQTISPIMLENFRGILECHYDHLPRRSQDFHSLETRSSTAPSVDTYNKLRCSKSGIDDSTIETLKCEAKMDVIDVAASEPLYAEIPCWRPPLEHAVEVINSNGEAITEL